MWLKQQPAVTCHAISVDWSLAMVDELYQNAL